MLEHHLFQRGTCIGPPEIPKDPFAAKRSGLAIRRIRRRHTSGASLETHLRRHTSGDTPPETNRHWRHTSGDASPVWLVYAIQCCIPLKCAPCPLLPESLKALAGFQRVARNCFLRNIWSASAFPVQWGPQAGAQSPRDAAGNRPVQNYLFRRQFI